MDSGLESNDASVNLLLNMFPHSVISCLNERLDPRFSESRFKRRVSIS